MGDATGEALAIVARAQENADTVMSEARAAATKEQDEIKERARELLCDARATASDVRSEGLEIAANLREMGDSLRSNAERLLRDVQRIHSQLVARLDRIDAGAGTGAAEAARRPGARARRTRPPTMATCSTCPSSSRRRSGGLSGHGARLDTVCVSLSKLRAVLSVGRGNICSMADANIKGNVAELEIATAAARLGIPVLKPLSEHARCDLAFEIGRRLWRVQCKWGRVARGGDVVIVTTSGCRHAPRG